MYERFRWRREQRQAARRLQARATGHVYIPKCRRTPAAIALRRRAESYGRPPCSNDQACRAMAGPGLMHACG